MSELKNIPDGWVETTLGEIGKLARGKSKHRPRWAPHLFGGDYPFIQTGQVKSARKYIKTYEQTYSEAGLAQSKLWEKDTLCITIAANIAEIAILEFPACFPDSVLGFRANEKKCDLDFIYYNFKMVQAELRQIAIGSVQDNINLGTFENLHFLLPPLPEQKSIASILTAFDDKIELLQAQNKTVEETAQTIFAEWFGKYSIDDELPDGWRVGKLSEIAEFLNGLALQKYPPIIGEESLPVIKIREIKQGITSNTDKANTHLDKKYIIENGDVIFSWSGSLDVVIWQYGKGALNQHLFKVSSDIYPKWFYYYWIINNLEEFRVIADSKATTMGHINRNHLDLAQVIIPNEIDFKKLNNLFNPLIEKLENNYQQIQTLTKTRDELLPRLMSGEVRVYEFKV